MSYHTTDDTINKQIMVLFWLELTLKECHSENYSKASKAF